MVAQINGAYIKARPTKLYSRLISYVLFEGRPVTTKGQWINPIVFALLGIAKHLPPPKKIEKPIFIIGTGRSGSTILGIVLSMHKDIGFLNEPKALWHSAYGGEDLIGSYSRNAARYRLGAEDATPEVKQAMHRMFGWYLAATGSRRVADKYPELIFRVPFVREIFPDAQFLFLVRNGWDTCHSIEHWSERLSSQHGSETHNWWGVENRKWKLLVEQMVPSEPGLAAHISEIASLTRHADMAAVEWIITMREGLRLRQQYPDKVHTVIYEDLTTQTDKTLSDLGKFCELRPDPVFENYAQQTLQPVRAKQPFDLHPAIQPEFDAVMRDLGYANDL